MEPNLTGNQNETIKPRTNNGSDTIIKPNPRNTDGLPQDPVYQGQSQKTGAVGESYEGFSNSKDSGMKNMDKAEGYGSKFQMPGPDMSEKYQANSTTNPVEGQADRERSAPAMGAEGQPGMNQFVDIQTSIQSIQMLVQKLKENLASPEQAELEHLMLQGTQLLTSNWKQLSSTATEQVSSIKGELKENPYRGLIGALKVGMALSQVWAATRAQVGTQAAADLQAPKESFDSAVGQSIH